MKIKLFFASLFLTFFAFALQAQTATPGVTARQGNQQERINEGVQSGELTKKEAVELEKQQRRINRSKKRAKADGEVTRAERAKIHARQNKASRDIHRQKNDRQGRKN